MGESIEVMMEVMMMMLMMAVVMVVMMMAEQFGEYTAQQARHSQGNPTPSRNV